MKIELYIACKMRYTAAADGSGILPFRRARKQTPLVILNINLSLYTIMKKTIITLLALAGVAAGVESSDITRSMMPTSYSSTEFYATNSGWSTLSLVDNSDFLKDFESSLSTDFALMGLTSTSASGSYYFNHKGLTENSAGHELSYANGALTLTGRSGIGKYVCFVTDVLVSDLLNNQSPSEFAELTLSMTSTAGSNTHNLWGLYKMDAEGKITEIEAVSAIGADTATITMNASQLAGLSSTDKLITFVSNRNAGGSFTISSLGYTVTPASIPEPATATLGLLALAGLAMRRRRK